MLKPDNPLKTMCIVGACLFKNHKFHSFLFCMRIDQFKGIVWFKDLLSEDSIANFQNGLFAFLVLYWPKNEKKMLSLCKVVTQNLISDEPSSNKNPGENVKYF